MADLHATSFQLDHPLSLSLDSFQMLGEVAPQLPPDGHNVRNHCRCDKDDDQAREDGLTSSVVLWTVATLDRSERQR